MDRPVQQPLFANRFDAGRQLAEKLTAFKGTPVIVLAIPNGGIPVGLQVALALEAEFDIIVSRKLPIPLRPEGGFGAVADDGTVILNQEVLKYLRLTQSQINYTVNRVRADIQQRSMLYRATRPISVLTGKTAIIVDDGLASGYTMMAAVESVRRKRPRQVIAAVPAASATAIKSVERVADKVVTVATGFAPKFYVSDYYQYWNVLSDEEGLRCLKEWQVRRQNLNLATEKNPPRKGPSDSC